MPTITIDGKIVEYKPGENLIEAARRAQVTIPYFCYHPGLTVVAQCRMCAVEIEGVPRVQTACSTPIKEGMVVKTKTEQVKRAQKSVMEFLLANHPLDCPICDKSGDCDLQDHSYGFGEAYTRFTEERRTYVDLDMGPVIQKNMNRCIHCTRCIRFGDEVANIREMVALKRGNNTEISTIDGKELETEYAGNYADICPTGSLTLKDFRFKKRSWYLKKTATVCDGCSRGCNTELQHENNTVYRCISRENLEVNRYWICDEGRFLYKPLQSENRITSPTHGSWEKTIAHFKSGLAGKKVDVLLGSDLTQEELTAAKNFAEKELKANQIVHFGTNGIRTTADDANSDFLLKRKSKTANLNGAEKLGLKPFVKLSDGTEAVLIIRSGRAEIPDIQGVKKYGMGVFYLEEANKLDGVLPGTGFFEKDGTIVNFNNLEQKLVAATTPPRGCKQISEILTSWNQSSGKAETASTSKETVRHGSI